MFIKRFFNKKIIYFLSIVPLFFILTGCYSKHDRELARKYEQQAKINAINYIKSKYNFEAKVINAKSFKNTSSLFPIPSSSPNGNVMVKMEAGTRKFYVYITGATKSNVGKDNYQQEEIEKDLINIIENETKIKQKDYYIEYPNNDIYIDFNANVISTYYNKRNLNEVLENIDKLEMYYVGEGKLSNLNLTKLSKLTSNTKISLISFKSQEDYDAYVEEKKQQENNACPVNCEEKLTIYVDSLIILNNGEINYNND